LTAIEALNAELITCRRCPRLVDWRETVAAEKRAAFADQHYWGRPVPGFGDPFARMLVVGLAPAAHGANRTGRMFTGDRSGDWLFRSLHRSGFANRPESVSTDDGLKLTDCYVTSSVHCAPPGNKPTAEEQANCSTWLEQEIEAFAGLRVIVALGGIGFDRVLRVGRRRGWDVPVPVPRFGHGVEIGLAREMTLLASYHPSQQNTFTGRLTEQMLDDVFDRAGSLARTG
jgi:uracil-DNA glycosylase family 4